MILGKHQFDDLDTLIETSYELFDRWVEEPTLRSNFEEDAIYRLRLAVHEWLANLVQHASFGGRTPHILLEVAREDDLVRCCIQDNSDGFDLDRQLEFRHDHLDALPERGMGLLMLQACSTDLSYTRGDGVNTLTFTISGEQEDPWLAIPFDL